MILCIGQSALDISIEIDEDLYPNKKYLCEEPLICSGGPACNAAYLCALWNERVTLITRIADDSPGKKLKQILAQQNIDLNYLIKDDKIETPYSFIVTNKLNGDRAVFNIPKYMGNVSYQLPEEKVDVILTDGKEVNISKEAIKKYSNAISILDAGSVRPWTLEIAKYVDYIICSQDFAQQYLGEELKMNTCEEFSKQFDEIKKLNQKNLIITLGNKGVMYQDNDTHKVCVFPAYLTKSIDTCGAGDIFHGAFAWAKQHGLDDIQAIDLASLTASISTEKRGGQTSIPMLEDVLSRKK